MRIRTPICGAVLMASTVLFGLAARADIPAQNHYWAKLDAIAEAAKVFTAGEAAAFKANLEKAATGDPRTIVGIDASYLKVEEFALFDAFTTLVKPHVEMGEVQKVNGFLKAVSDGRWIRGQLVARKGGDFVTVLEVVAGEDGTYLFRQVNRAANPGAWNGTTFDRSLGVSVKKVGVAGGKAPQAGAPQATAKPETGWVPPKEGEPGFRPGGEAYYLAPKDIWMTVGRKTGQGVNPEEIVLVGKLKVLIGKPTDMKITFYCSPDLSVEPKDIPVTEFKPGVEQTFEARVRPGKGKTDEMGPWVRMMLTYRPDKAAICAAVRADRGEYQDDYLREALVKAIQENEPVKRDVVEEAFLTWPFSGRRK